MANEVRLIDANDLWADIMMIPHNGDMISSEEVEQAIKDAPTVDAVPVVHGRWEDGFAVDSNGKKIYDSIDCTKCDGVFEIESYDREYWKTRFMFCPFCGSLMDGDGNA